MKNVREMTGMAWIDENSLALVDHKGVTIVFILVLPKIGIEALFKFHKINLLSQVVTTTFFSLNENTVACQIL